MSRWTTASFWALTGSMALIAAYPARAAPVAMIPGPEQADSIPTDTAGSGLPYLQCVPYARKVSGIQLFGDAHTWWDQAEGRYERGFTPKVGAVMSFHAHGAMRLGHVAMVSRIIDSRTVLLRHANWSPINGMRGQPEDDVRAVDVSDSNDWSEVRVWYAPIQDLGTTHWPVDGFIYNRTPHGKPGMGGPIHLARGESAVPGGTTPRLTLLSAPAPKPASASRNRIDASFLDGLSSDKPSQSSRTARRTYLAAHIEPARTQATSTRRESRAVLSDDPIGRIIASHMSPAARLR